MKLSDYLSDHQLTDAEFAGQIGRDRTAVTRWRRGTTRPDWDALARILDVTDGAVTANDFAPADAADRGDPKDNTRLGAA
jgi:transcriptional regulator with XRE-family HTH domain